MRPELCPESRSEAYGAHPNAQPGFKKAEKGRVQESQGKEMKERKRKVNGEKPLK